MSSKFFINKKLLKNIEKDIKKRNKIEDEIERKKEKLADINKGIHSDIEQFYDEVDDSTVFSTFKHIEEHGTLKQKETLKEIEQRYKKSALVIEDTLNLVDWYEKMCDFNNNRDIEGQSNECE